MITYNDMVEVKDEMEQMEGKLAKAQKKYIGKEHAHRLDVIRILMLGTLAFLDADIADFGLEGIGEMLEDGENGK